MLSPPSTCAPSSPSSDVILSISGMSCGGCTRTVRKILLALPGIQTAAVSFLTSRVTLQTTVPFSLPSTLEALSSAGFHATPVTSSNHSLYLQFPDATSANRALSILQSAAHTICADIFTPLCTRGLPTTHKSSFLHTISLRTSDKLAVVEQLHTENLSYHLIPSSDPTITGTLAASDLLQREVHVFRRHFFGALFFTLPLAFLTMLFSRVPALGSNALSTLVAGSAFRVVDVIAFILATPVQFIFGYRFYRGTFYAIRRRRADMNVLIALGTTVAYGFSVIVLVVNTIQVRNGLTATDEKPAFETAALLITIVLFGKWMEALAKKQTAAGVEALANLAPRDVRLVSPPPRVADLFDKGVHAELVSVGDYFRVSASGVFPLDAMLVVGDTLVDEAMLTGESWPVAKQPGDTVYAGTVNGRNSVVVCCKAESSDTMLEQIVRLVKRAQDARAPIEAFADKLSAWFVPVVLSIAVCSTVVWFVLAQTNSIPAGWLKGEGNVLFAILFGLAVLVIACPCALGLATPTVIMVATSIGATRLGILYKDGGEALQAAHNVHTVLFDKTGTLTVGKPSVTATASFDIDVESKELINVKPEESMHDVSVAGRTLEYMAAAESQCDHPISQAIIQYAEEKSGVAWKAIKVRKHKELAGKGIRCVVEGNRTVVIGKAEWVLSQEGYAGGAGVRMSIACERMLSMWENAGRTVVFGHVSGEQMIGFGVEDAVRPESARVVAFLQSNGIRCGMITGDGIGTAKSVAKVVGIKEDYIRARALPGDKVEAVKWFSTDKEGESRKAKQTAGGVVFIGDGINDAGALSAATVGIAMGCGSEIAAESAGIVLVKCNLWGVVVALDLARVAFRRIKGNYVWALGFNSLGIPLAAGAAYPVLEKRIPPYAAAAAMALSSVIVVMSSLALRLYQSPKEYQQSPKVTRTS